MSIDVREYRRTIGLFATGVTVIVAEFDGSVHAMTANAVSSLSLDPLLLLVCVDKRAKMLSYLEKCKYFTVNVLSEDQEGVSAYFAGQAGANDPEPEFVAWRGGLKLEATIATLGCEPYQRLEGGDHVIVLGKVDAIEQAPPPRKPLLYYEGGYKRIAID